MKRAAIYVRVSLDREGTKASPETQEAECRALCRSRGWEVAGVFSDRDRSAFRGARRPQFERLLHEVEQGRANVVVAYKLDRLTRGGISGLWPILERLKRVDVGLAFVHDQVDTTTPLGEGVLGLLASMAKQESENLSRRVRSAHARAAREGAIHTGGSRQFGYERDGSIVVSESAVVREVHARIIGGETLRQIAFDLNRRGVKTTRGNEWTSQTLGQMIRSPRLAALRVRDGEAFHGKWEAILTPDEHFRIVDALARSPAVGRSVLRHLLTGLAVCGVCGGSMKTMGFVMKNGKSFPRYQCLRQPGFANCGHVAVTKTSLDAYVVGQTLDLLARGFLAPLSEDEDHLARMKHELETDQGNLTQLTQDRFVHRRIPHEAYISASERLNSRIAALCQEIEAIERQREVLGPLQLERGSRQDLQRWWDQAPIVDRRAALGQVILRVKVNPATRRGGNTFDRSRIEIEWRSWSLGLRLSESAWQRLTHEEQEQAIRDEAEAQKAIDRLEAAQAHLES